MPCVGSRMGVVGGGGGGGGVRGRRSFTLQVCSVNERRYSYASPPLRSIISFQLLVTSLKSLISLI